MRRIGSKALYFFASLWLSFTISNPASASLHKRVKNLQDGIRGNDAIKSDLESLYSEAQQLNDDEDGSFDIAWGWVNWSDWGNWGNWDNWNNWNDFDNYTWQDFSNYGW